MPADQERCNCKVGCAKRIHHESIRETEKANTVHLSYTVVSMVYTHVRFSVYSTLALPCPSKYYNIYKDYMGCTTTPMVSIICHLACLAGMHITE